MLTDSKIFLDALRHSVSTADTSQAVSHAFHPAPILHVAEKMRRIFQLPVPDAPRLFLVGGQVDGAAFGPLRESCPAISVTGSGFDLLRAAASCVGEAVEFLSQLVAPDRAFVTGSPGGVVHGLEREALGQMLAMAGFSADDPAPGVPWTEGRSLFRGEPVLLPAPLCFRNVRDSGGPEPRVKLSSGCGAGPTPEAALLHALLELVERDAVGLWWLGGRRGRQAATGVPATLMSQLGREQSSRTTWLLDITTDLAVPCIAAFSVGAEGHGFACGFAARLNYAEAVRAAILEMCQMEVGLYLILLKQRQVGDGALTDVDRKYLRRAFGFQVHDCELLFPSESIPPIQWEAVASLDDLARRLNSHAVEVFWVELTRPDLGIPAVRALAPCLQPYPSDIVTPRLRRQWQETGGGFGYTSGIHLM